jgi:hypothetical protein
MDNYEWHEGYNPEGKFGLFSIDRDQPDLSRVMTKGAKILNKLVLESTSTSSNGEVTDESISKTEEFMVKYSHNIK